MERLVDVGLWTYGVVFLIGLVGAALNFFRRELAGFSFVKKIFLFLLDVLSSGLLAVLGFYAALGIGLNELLSVAISGIFAHQGTRAIYLIELVIAEKFGAKQTFQEIKNSKGR